MNILLITNLYPGYEEQPNNEIPHVVHYYARRWLELGHQVRVIRLWPRYCPWAANMLKKNDRMLAQRAFPYDFVLDGVKVSRIPVKKPPIIDYFSRHIREAAEKINEYLQHDGGFTPDVILCHALNPQAFIAEIVRASFAVPLVAVLHTVDIKDLLRKRRFVRRCMQLFGETAALGFRSPEIKRNFYRIMTEATGGNDVPRHSHETSGFVIPSGVEASEVLDHETFMRKASNRISRITLAANLIARKHVDSLLRAFARLCDEFDLRLRIIGNGPEFDRLLALSRTLAIEERVEFTGYRERRDVFREMEASELFILISSKETFGLVYVEAMAKGCLVIGSRDEGIQGTIGHGRNGFLCKAGDDLELEALMRQVLRLTEAERREILLRARETVLGLTQERLSDTYLDILRSCL